MNGVEESAQADKPRGRREPGSKAVQQLREGYRLRVPDDDHGPPAELARTVSLMLATARVEEEIAATLRAMAGDGGGEVAARRTQLAAEADQGALTAARRIEVMQ